MTDRSPVTVLSNATDNAVLGTMVERSSALQVQMASSPEVEVEGAERYIAWADLLGDSWRSWHTVEDPGVKDADEVLHSRELNRRINQRRTSTEGFNKLRAKTQHDRNAATFAALAEADELRKALHDHLPEFMDEVRDMAQREQELADAQAGGDEDAVTAAQEALDAMRDDQGERGLGQALTEAIERAQEEADEQVEALMAMPGLEPGSPVCNNPDALFNLVGQWRETKQMRDLAQQIGRFLKDIETKRETKLIGGPGEIVDIETGNDLSRVLPSEIARAGHPVLLRDFLRRFMERDLLQYQTVGETHAGLGPAIFVVDGSLSMAGLRTVWARATGIAFTQQLHREGRDVSLIEFSDPRTDPISWDFLRGAALDPARILSFAQHFFNGGTDITRGLQRAREFIDTRPAFTRADIVVITDGEDNFEQDDEELRDTLREQGVRFHGVAIGHTPHAGGYLPQLCDTLVRADELADPSGTTDHLATNL